jgi:hypothetical protein
MEIKKVLRFLGKDLIVFRRDLMGFTDFTVEERGVTVFYAIALKKALSFALNRFYQTIDKNNKNLL